MNFDTLEERATPAASSFYVDDHASDYTLVSDNDNSHTVTNGDGVTWNGPTTVSGLTFGTNAFTSIQQAVNAANSGDTINVAAGTYNEHVFIAKPLTIRGAN